MAFSDADSGSKDVHYLAKCVLRGSAVLQAVCGHFRSPSSFDIIFGKETSIELVIVVEDGNVQSICEQSVFGIIKDLAVLHWNEKHHATNVQAVDLLVVLSDSGKLSFLTFCMEMYRFYSVTHIQLSKPGNLRYQLGRMLAVDSRGSFVAVSAYEDRLALFSLSISAGSNIVDKKILYPPENGSDANNGRGTQRINISGTIWSMCFIQECLNHSMKDGCCPILAMVLHRSGAILNELLLLGGDSTDHSVHIISQYTEAGPLALSITEVPHLPGFGILFRAGDFLVMDLRDPCSPICIYRTDFTYLSSVNERASMEEACRVLDVDDEGMFKVAASALLELRDSGSNIVKADDFMNVDSECGVIIPSKLTCSWSWEPGNISSSKLILCLDTGEIFTVGICLDSVDGIKVNLSDCLYRGLPFKVLLWVNDGFIASLAEMGDGFIFKLEHGKLFCRGSIQNIAPILDFSVVDYQDERQSQMFACCGMNPEGSLRIIRNGISIEKLLRTAPIYPGITSTWTLGMKENDLYHSFLVLSFVEETRVLTVGLSFIDVTDPVGFDSNVCTLASGVVADGLLVQIHAHAVKLCLPTMVAHPEGVPLSAPVTTSWTPYGTTISLGTIGHHSIIVATSNPCLLFILAVLSSSAYHYEICEIQHVTLQFELSCICMLNLHNGNCNDAPPSTFNSDKIFAVGTHKPSVEILQFVPGKGLSVLAIGSVSLVNTMGNAVDGCIPQDVKLILVDCLYVLLGLRNGLLLRFEWPVGSHMVQQVFPGHGCHPDICFSKADHILSSAVSPLVSEIECNALKITDKAKNYAPVSLQLIAVRRVGITPVFLVPLHESPNADVIVLSDRPWLLHTARHSLSYTSIAFQSATHVTPVRFTECPKGMLFVSENCLHLVEMVQSKRLNVQKIFLGGTPRKVIFYNENRLLLVMRTDLNGATSDICIVDPHSGSFQSLHKFDNGETPKCMQIVKVGSEPLLVVGTSRSTGRAIMSSGEAESTRGRLLVFSLEYVQNADGRSLVFDSVPSSSSSPFHEIVGYATKQLSSSSICSSPDDNNSSIELHHADNESWQLRLLNDIPLPGMVLTVSPYLDGYVLASAGNNLYIYGFLNKNLRPKRFASAKTRFTITCLTTLFTTIAVGDCRDGVLFYSYHEDLRKLEQLYCDPMQRLVGDCALMHMDVAAVSDRKGSLSILSRPNNIEDNVCAECNLVLNCSYYMGETAMSIKKGSFSYMLPVDDALKGSDHASAGIDSMHNSIVASTLLGSVITFIPISREEHELLERVQAKLACHPLTAPVLGNDHNEFRGRGSPSGIPKILDGDLLAQFLELTSLQQETVLSSECACVDNTRSRLSHSIPVNRVVRLLERIYYALS